MHLAGPMVQQSPSANVQTTSSYGSVVPTSAGTDYIADSCNLEPMVNMRQLHCPKWLLARAFLCLSIHVQNILASLLSSNNLHMCARCMCIDIVRVHKIFDSRFEKCESEGEDVLVISGNGMGGFSRCMASHWCSSSASQQWSSHTAASCR